MTGKIAPWAYVLAVRDLAASTAYYRDVLGFRIQWEEGNGWRLAERGEARLMLGHCPDEKPAGEIGDHSWFGYLEVADAGALRTEFISRGAQCGELHDQPYGMREFMVTTIDGHRIMFGQPIGRNG